MSIFILFQFAQLIVPYPYWEKTRMKAWKKIVTVLLAIAVILAAVFLAGRYGWKLGGFRACQGAGITAVEVGEKTVHITGF